LSGILYRATELTSAFVSLLKAPYAAALRERAVWVSSRFGDLHDRELESFMSENVGRWGGEFDRLSALRELDL
jgi:hypothetical protein